MGMTSPAIIVSYTVKRRSVFIGDCIITAMIDRGQHNLERGRPTLALRADLVVRLVSASVHRNARKGVGVRESACLRNVLIPLWKGSCNGVPTTQSARGCIFMKTFYNRIYAVMPLDVLGRTRATLMDSSSFLP